MYDAVSMYCIDIMLATLSLAAEEIAAAASAVLGPPPNVPSCSNLSEVAALALEHAGPVSMEPATDPNTKPRLVLRLRRVVI